MNKLLRNLMISTSPFALAAEGGSGGGGGDPGAAPAAGAPPAPAPDPKTPENVLFPDEGKKPDAAPDPAGKKEGDDKAADWKEYVNDPAKSDADNAAAKAEHDKTKPADDKDKNAAADKVPEDGKYTLAMPEGVEVDQELVDAVSPRFKELGLTQKQAQALTDDFIKVQTARAAKQGETWGNTIQKWVDDAKADKEIGGDKWDGTVKDAMRAVNALGTPALKEYLQASGGGNHPELIRVFAKAGKLIKEDDPAKGGAEGAGKPADAAHVLFPNDVPKG